MNRNAPLITAAEAAQNIRVADEWREVSGHFDGTQYRQHDGWVVVFAGQVAGWMMRLCDPHRWMPGSYAVLSDGNQYQAVGGDSYNGADSWERVWTVPYEGVKK